MVLDARGIEISLNEHVRYVDTGTIGQVVDKKTIDDVGWVRIDKTYGICQIIQNYWMKKTLKKVLGALEKN